MKLNMTITPQLQNNTDFTASNKSIFSPHTDMRTTITTSAKEQPQKQ